MEEKIETYKERLNTMKIENMNLTNEYVMEHLETQKVKNARERLDTLRKELGI